MPGKRAQIRLARSEDLEPVVDLLLIQLHEHRIAIERERLRQGVSAWLERPERGIILAGIVGTRIVGVACIDFMWPLEHGGLGGWLEELYVLPEYRNVGVGSKLLAAAVSECERRGCLALDLEVENDHVRVETLYARHGFVPIHSRRRWVKKLGQGGSRSGG